MNPYLEILRPYTSFLSAFGVVAGAIVAGVPLGYDILIAAFAAFLVSGAGIVFNDIYDVKVDRINAPKRPIPSKRISEKNARNYGMVLFILGISIAATLNFYCLILAAVNSILEFVYARNLKQVAIVGNAMDSWFVASTFIFGAALSGNFGSVLVLSILAFLANMGREIFGDVEDIKGDAKLGLKTLPIIAGERVSWFIASSFILLAVCLSFVPFFLDMLGIKYLIIVIAADILFLFSIFQEPKFNQKITKIAMLIAMLAFIAGVLW